MTAEATPATGTAPFRWDLIRQSLARPYRVTLPMVILVSLVPLYIFIPELVRIEVRYPSWRSIARFLSFRRGRWFTARCTCS